MTKDINIYEFEDYRAFLKLYLRTLPQKGRGQISKLSEHLGLNISVLSLVLSGERDFTPEHAYETSEYFAWTTHAKEYFCLLNQFQRAGTHKLKSHLKIKIKQQREQAKDLGTQVKRDIVFNEEQKSVFYSHFAYSAIRMFSCFENGITIEELENDLKLTRLQLVEMLRFLQENNLVIEKAGRYFVGPQTTHLEKKSIHFKQNHTNWSILGIQKIDQHKERDFFYTSPFAISKQDFMAFREELTGLIKRFVTLAKDSKADQVGCLTINFFGLD